VTDPAVSAGPPSTSWRLINVTLLVLALLLVAATVFFWIESANATPGDEQAASLSKEYRSVTKAAEAETVAFLTVDYTDMDPLIAKVLAGATDPFKAQYDGAKANLKSSAQTAQAVSTGKVLSTGVSEIDGNTAVVFVAADSQVKNKSTKGKAEPRYYRLKLTMTKKSGDWLMANLQFVS
jgi:Mce-associated membrane protein